MCGNMNDHHDDHDCCFGHEVEQDRVCCKFTLFNPGTAGARINQDIYVNNTGQCVVASGAVSLGCALAPDPGVVAAVRFFRGGTATATNPVGGGTQVGESILVREESCITFTASGFTRINITAFLPPNGRISGNICLSPRYQLHV